MLFVVAYSSVEKNIWLGNLDHRPIRAEGPGWQQQAIPTDETQNAEPHEEHPLTHTSSENRYNRRDAVDGNAFDGDRGRRSVRNCR